MRRPGDSVTLVPQGQPFAVVRRIGGRERQDALSAQAGKERTSQSPTAPAPLVGEPWLPMSPARPFVWICFYSIYEYIPK